MGNPGSSLHRQCGIGAQPVQSASGAAGIDPGVQSELEQCRQEVQKMLEIESELLWWAEKGKICTWQARPHFDGRIQLLEEALNSLNEDNIAQASAWLRDYASKQTDSGTGVIRF